jgi:hypothetical protein
MKPVLPDLDIWLKAFSRQDPDPLVVHGFKLGVERRQVFLFGLVRQALLARTRDDRQFARLTRVLSGFPDVTVLSNDHVRAAALIQSLRRQRRSISPWQALMWAVSERSGGVIWSGARTWTPLAAAGCPVSSSPPG